MELKDVKRKDLPKTKRLNLRATEKVSIWMSKENVSPQLIFDKAIEELMKKKK